MKIILASSSPRRKEILEGMNVKFKVIPSMAEEKFEQNKQVEGIVLELATNKAKDVFSKTDNDRIVIGADTVVAFENKIIGKPKDRENAKKILQMLRGKSCITYTGMCVIAKDNIKEKEYVDVACCEVYIKNLTDKEIDKYIETNEPLDKAGGFAIQGIGARYIESIKGDYYSCVGLSISSIYDILKKIETDFNVEII